MQYQQNLTSFEIAVVVIVTPRLQLQVLERALGPLREALANVTPGQVVHVTIPT